MAAAGIPLLGHVQVRNHDLAAHPRREPSHRLANSTLDSGVGHAAHAINRHWQPKLRVKSACEGPATEGGRALLIGDGQAKSLPAVLTESAAER